MTVSKKNFSLSRTTKAALSKAAVLTVLLTVTSFAAYTYWYPWPPLPANNNAPTGHHDLSTCDTLAGWARDADSTAATSIQIWRDAPAGYGVLEATVSANLYRSDLPFADKSHGYVTPTPAAFKTGNLVYAYIYAVDLDVNGNPAAGGTNRLLGGGATYLYCP